MFHILKPAGIPLGVEPMQWREAVRERIEHHFSCIDALMMALDRMDGDENLEEPGDLEPSLGWTDRGQGSHSLDDREADDADDEDGSDGEPWLGAPERHNIYIESGISQTLWAAGCLNDAEPNEDEADYDGGENDFPMLIPGGSEQVAS